MRHRSSFVALLWAGVCAALLSLAGCTGDLEDGPLGPDGVGPRLPPVDCEGADPLVPSERVPRLTFEQYDRAVRDLVGLDVHPASELGGDPGDVFTRQLVDGLEAAAADVAAQLVADDAALARVMPCMPASAADEAACASELIRSFGRRAYRRPLSEAERARYELLFADRAMLTASGTFLEGVQLIVEAFLQSPGFLLRVEQSTTVRDGRIPLTPYELAQRLSFALWGSVPDDVLLDAAESGALASPDEVRRQAERMLGEPAARELVAGEHRVWLGMEGAYAHFWTNVRRDSHPEFAGITDEDLATDVLGSLDRAVFEDDGSVVDLLTTTRGMVNERTAPLYGLSGPFSGWTPVDLTDRPGVLTRVGFLASHARATRSSLIYRGAFVVRRLLCEEVGTPPAGAESTPLPETSGLVTTRDRVDAMTSGGTCASCHTHRINPAGYALEGFDEVGRARALDNGEPVDTTGSIQVGAETLAYEDPATFATALAESPSVQRCYVRRWVELTFDRDMAREDRCVVNDLADRLSTPGYGVRDMLLDLVVTDGFLHRSPTEME